jgi:branched-chain amino acid transport system substrate-binding protein
VALLSAQDAPLYLGYKTYVDKMKVPVLGGNVYTTAPWTTNPMFFPQGGTEASEAEAPLSFMDAKHLTKVGMIACSGAVQCTEEVTALRSEAKAAGLDFAYGANPSNDAPTYTATCVAAKDAGVQILDLGISTSTEGLAIAQDCARQGYHPDWIVPGEALGGGYLSSSFNTTYNFSLTEPWYSTLAVMKDFHAAMKKYTKINFTTVEEPLLATDSWASGLMFQKAVELSGATGAPTSADVLAGLKKFKNQTLTGFIGPVTFTNPSKKVGDCYFVNAIKSDKFVQEDGGKPVCNK